MLSALIISLFLLASDPPPPAPETSPPAPATPEQPAADTTDAAKSRIVCRRESKPNTRFTYKVCKTVGEWDERTKAAEEALGSLQSRPTVKICSPTGGCD